MVSYVLFGIAKTLIQFSNILFFRFSSFHLSCQCSSIHFDYLLNNPSVCWAFRAQIYDYWLTLFLFLYQRLNGARKKYDFVYMAIIFFSLSGSFSSLSSDVRSILWRTEQNLKMITESEKKKKVRSRKKGFLFVWCILFLAQM